MITERSSRQNIMPIIISRFMMTGTVLLSAFLLFQIQPLIAKYILPWFGGAAMVWTICMLFFQLALLVGYSYSHMVVTHFKPRAQGLVHGALLALTLLFIPISPDRSLMMEYSASPIIGILSLLAYTIGVPYLALSTTSSLIQSWFAALNPTLSPYPLYALSNVGSVIALISYPILFETNFRVDQQASYWSVGYGIFVGLLIIISLYISRSNLVSQTPKPQKQTKVEDFEESPGVWLSLAAAASISLLATTDHLSRDVAAVPFLWVVPLVLYLLSFILCFESDRWYRRRLFAPLFLVFLAAFVSDNLGMLDYSFIEQIILYCGMLFVICMLCHGELAARRPPPSGLTKFYLVVAVGGAIGGLYVGIIAPNLFVLPLELFVGLTIVIFTLTIVIFKDRKSSFYQGNQPWFWRSYAVFVAFFIAFFYFQNSIISHQVIEFKRNFYGTLRVIEKELENGPRVRSLVHGTTRHGIEIIDGSTPDLTPTAYYSYESGLGQALSMIADKPMNIGMIGLGIGTVATYGGEGDNFRIYEINPQVTEMAYKHFSYLNATAAAVEIIHGDGRMLLEAEAPQQFDLLVVDAFSGDAIPVHLLTSEAMALYASHLKEGGILAVHTTNVYLELRPVVLGAARTSGFEAVEVNNAGDRARAVHKSQWFILTKDALTYEKLNAFSNISVRPDDVQEIVWSDDFSNIFSILK